MSTLAPLLQAFFTDRLIGQRNCSRHTITGYRTTFRLLLAFATTRTGKTPSALDITDLDAPLIGAFLDHLESQRGNQARTRNNRLAAIHSLFSYAALRHPEYAATIQRVLAIPTKRCDRNLVTWLTEAEVDALLAAPDRATWTGRRDHAMLVLAAQTGLRISELTGLTLQPQFVCRLSVCAGGSVLGQASYFVAGQRDEAVVLIEDPLFSSALLTIVRNARAIIDNVMCLYQAV